MLPEAELKTSKLGLLPTPARPPDLGKVELSENARQVFLRRYARRDSDGAPLETVEETFWRVAYHVAAAEQTWGEEDIIQKALRYYDLLSSRCFFPNSPTFTGAGTPLGQLAACFVLPISDDMGREPAGIFQTLRDAALIQQTGGGNGFAFSRLRPKGVLVKSSAGQATGPVGFLRVYDKAFGEVAQGGCLLPNTLVFTDHGLLRLDEIVGTDQTGWQEHELNVATDQGWRSSPRAYNNGVATVLRVHTRQGLSIAGTYEHRVKVMAAGGPEWRTLRELQPGDWILVHLGQHQGSHQKLRHPSREHGNQVCPNLPVILDEELAFFLGYLAGNGFVDSKVDDHRVGVRVPKKSYLLEEMPALIKRLFGVEAVTIQKAKASSIILVIHDQAVKEFLLVNGLKKSGNREMYVPRLIRQSPREVVGAFLRGLFEASGVLSHHYPMFSTTSARLVEEAATLLIGLGCPVHIRSVTPGTNHSGQLRTYQARIVSSAGLRAWRKNIGCDLRSRFISCYSWEIDRPGESDYMLPNPRYWLQPWLDVMALEQVDYRGQIQQPGRQLSPLRRAILDYIRDERSFTHSSYGQICRQDLEIADGAPSAQNTWFVQVSAVEPEGEALTLDLEVDENHTYLANGMVTHNTRRGANMAVLRVDHPDVEEFITCKTDENAITNFNISVGITDAFMEAVRRDDIWELRFPDVSSPKYHGFDGTLEQAEQAGIPIKVHRRVRARDLFAKIVRQAHHNGEPGVLFLDAANRSNPVPHLYQLEATNPCGEQWLGSYENCCLGSVNLAQHCGPNGTVNWGKLRASVALSTRFLDDVVTANAYVPAVPQLKEAAYRARRIGLGIMGLGDLMYHAGIRYGSEEGQEFAAQVMEFVRYHAMLTSIELAKERGPFEAIRGSIYDPADLKWQAPQPLAPYTRHWGRPDMDWGAVLEGIRRHGIRNAAQTTVAPTGTIATVAGCEGYGCEPVFALAYIRHVNDNGADLQLTYTSPLFEKALVEGRVPAEIRSRIVSQVMEQGTCQGLAEVPEHIRRVFVVSQDITSEEHVRMQSAMQAFVDNSLSKCVTGDSLVLTEQGLVPISSFSDMRLPDQFCAHDLNIISPSGLERSDYFYYGGMRPTLRLKLKHGFEIEGTPNHRIQILQEDGRVDFVQLDELKVGDMAVLYMGQQVFGPAGQQLSAYTSGWRTRAKHIRFPERMSAGLAYVLGCITSEGSIYKNGVQIRNGDRALLERLGENIRHLFGLESHIHQDKRRESLFSLQINSRPLRDWLLVDLGMAAGASNKTIPECILRASQSEIAAFLRGLFLDAYLTLDGRMFGIGLASRALLRQLQILLLNFGVLSSIHRSAERAWALTVSGEALELLASFIEFDEVWKNQRIETRNDGRTKVLHNYGTLLPAEVTIRLREMQANSAHSVRSLYGEQTREYQRARVNLLQGFRLERALARRLFEHSCDDRSDYAEQFFSHDRNGRLYLGIKSIEAGFAEVFDISVPGSHAFIANGLGNHNTVNFPENATEEDVAMAYNLAWEQGCKGITVYVTGSRQKVVLETNATAKTKHAAVAGTQPGAAQPEQIPMWHETKKPRPRSLPGYTYKINTPLGKAFVTINENGGDQPFEVFINTSKAGSETAAVSEAIGRLISYILRLASPVAPRDRLKEVIRQLSGIGGGRSLGFGPNRVRSLPDGVSQALEEYLENANAKPAPLPPEGESDNGFRLQAETPAEQPQFKIGDLCPECGQAAVVNEEGCRKCYSCGYSEC